MALALAPITVKRALPFVREVHRRLPRVQGAMWAVSVRDGETLVGVVLVGHPARVWNDTTLAVLRCAVIEGHPNACSMLYGAASRAARAIGAQNLVTYTHGDEHGTSLKASGWIDGGMTTGGEHSRESRKRNAAGRAANATQPGEPQTQRSRGRGTQAPMVGRRGQSRR